VRYLLCVLAGVAMMSTGGAGAADIMVLTSSDAVASSMARRVALTPVPGSVAVELSRGTYPTAGRQRPYRLLLARVSDLAAVEPALVRSLVKAHTPRYMVVLDSGLPVGDKLSLGDLAVARLVWDFRKLPDRLEPIYSRQFRADGALLNAALLLGDGWRPPVAAAKTEFGAIAAGPWQPEYDRRDLTDLLAGNARTIALLPDAARIAAAVEALNAEGLNVGLIMMAAIPGAAMTDSDPGRDAASAENGVAFLLSLIAERWPVRPR
jgi:hypothetical protein